MTFDIRNYLDQLDPHPETKGAYLCPVCSTGKLTHNKTNGAYHCWAGCEVADIREALSPACNPNTGLTQAEREERRQAAAAQRERDAFEAARAYDAAAVRAREEWDTAVPLTEADSALVEASYWTRKGLRPVPDARIAVEGEHRGAVLFAVRRSDGTLRSLQRCHPDSRKENFTGGEMKGGAGLLGTLTDAAVVAIAEGPATAGSIHQLTGWPTLIGFSTNGLPYAAAIARALAPQAQMVFCADNDRSGAGEAAAGPLAKQHGAVVIMPPDGPDDRKKWDFNDMHQAEGDEATRELLISALQTDPGTPGPDSPQDGHFQQQGTETQQDPQRQPDGAAEPQQQAKSPQTFDDCWAALEAHVRELVRARTPRVKALASIAYQAKRLGVPSSQRDREHLLDRLQPNLRRRLTQQQRMDAFEHCVRAMSGRERNTIRRRQRLRKVAADLGLTQVSAQDISQMVIEAKDAAAGNAYKALTAEDRAAMEWPDVDWLIPGLLPAGDLSIIGGRPKVGKTSLAMALTAAILTQRETIGFSAPKQARPVLLVTDDQGDADTRDALQRLGVFNHPALLWSRRFRMTERDIDNLLEDIRRNPGAVVIIDSLRSVTRSLGVSENDPELGTVVYDLKAAVTDAGGSLVLIHHCNKSSSGTGVEALSGHSAIAGAANTVVTLHYVENDKGQPNKEAPQRRMTREGRTGRGFDVVINRDDTGAGFALVGTYAAWMDQHREASAAEKREERRTETQSSILDLMESDPGREWTTREVVEALGHPWEKWGTVGPGARIREALTALADVGEIQRRKATGNSVIYSLAATEKPSVHTHVVLKNSQVPQVPQDPLPDRALELEEVSQVPQVPPQPPEASEVEATTLEELEVLEESSQAPQASPCNGPEVLEVLEEEDTPLASDHADTHPDDGDRTTQPVEESSPQWPLTPEQRARAREVFEADPMAHPNALKLRFEAMGVKVKLMDVPLFIDWVMGGAA